CGVRQRFSRTGLAAMLEFFSGSSTAVNPASAMRECLSRALGNEGNPGGCNLFIIHSTIGHNTPQFLSAALAPCPASPILRCSASGIIRREGVTENMRALAVMAVRGEEVAAVCGEGINGRNSREVAREAAARLASQRARINLIYVLAPGLDIAGDSVINGIEEIFGSDVPIF